LNRITIKLRLVVLLIPFLAIITGCTTIKLEPYTPTDGAFSVLMPGKPRVFYDKLEEDTLHLKDRIHHCDFDSFTYIVREYVLSRSRVLQNDYEVQRSLNKLASQYNKGKYKATSTSQLSSPYAGREMEGTEKTLLGSTRDIRVRIFYAGKGRFFTMKVIGDKKAVYSDEASEFLDSLSVDGH